MSIVMQNMCYWYSKGTPFEKQAIADINLEIKSGEFVGIIGHTGSGKSTLVQHINGLLLPSSGSITVNGLNLLEKGNALKQVRRQVGLVFQYPEHQLFEETVYKDIAYGPKNQGLDEAEIDQRVREAAESVGLDEDVLFRSPFELSGGQKRRVAIAGVLAMDPKILVLDEPAAGLDPRGRDEFYGEIQELHHRKKITVILVSHSMEDIALLVERIIVMNQGHVEMDGAPGKVFQKSERLEEIGLTVPQVTLLMKRLGSVDSRIPEGIHTIADAKKVLLGILKEGNFHGA